MRFLTSFGMTVVFFISGGAGFFSCNCAQKNIAVKNQELKKDFVSTSSSVTESDSNQYRITISFYSNGNGTDYKILEKFKKFIKEFEQTKGVTLTYDITNWGEEGETDYCFKLSELTPKEQDRFANDSKAVLKESGLVNIEEHAPCRYKK